MNLSTTTHTMRQQQPPWAAHLFSQQQLGSNIPPTVKGLKGRRRIDTEAALAPSGPTLQTMEVLPPTATDSSLLDTSSDTAVVIATETSFAAESTQSSIPRRNLADAFEELSTASARYDLPTPGGKPLDVSSALISPTGVEDFASVATTSEPTDLSVEDEVPHFYLSEELRRDLSQGVVNRVSFYGVIHDINKEACSMAANDFSSFNRSTPTEGDDQVSPLVLNVTGAPTPPHFYAMQTDVQEALIDEERWLLSAIEARGDDESRSVASCPPTFLQAMGEREYAQSSIDSSRTQLWKPSRSWWEAKSGKNPWIEPKSHNKRWRYLWPLIHYHKFLAKCIKKLKRNGVDVKVSVSPVAVFLREEVCAISDHLARVSLFGSEEWMKCLEKFEGWTDHSPRAEGRLRKLVGNLKLRPLGEPGDVESPLLRTQIDEQFLRSMVAAREQMAQASRIVSQEDAPREPSKKTAGTKKVPETSSAATSSRPGLPLHPQSSRQGVPPVHPRARRPHQNAGGSDSKGSAPESSSSRPSNAYHGWWGHGWAPQYVYGDDGTSVQSALSGDSLSCHYPQGHEYNTYNPYYNYHHPPHGQDPHALETSIPDNAAPAHDGYYYPPMPYYPDPALTAAAGWYGMAPPPMGDPNMMYGPPPSPVEGMKPPATPGGPVSPQEVPPTPQHHHSPTPVPLSPFWGHLDYATLAMTGIMTPQAKPRVPQQDEQGEEKKESEEAGVVPGEPLYPHAQYYNPYGYYGEGYAPPSPATQFMMSPQANPQAAAYYGAGYYGSSPAYFTSPRRPSRRRSSPRTKTPTMSNGTNSNSNENLQIVSEDAAEMATPPKVVRSGADGRESPVTIETSAETESVSAACL